MDYVMLMEYRYDHKVSLVIDVVFIGWILVVVKVVGFNFTNNFSKFEHSPTTASILR